MTSGFPIRRRRQALLTLTAILASSGAVDRIFAADAEGRIVEHVSFTNGFDMVCDHREQIGDRMRLYTGPDGSNYVEVAAADVALIEKIALPAETSAVPAVAKPLSPAAHRDLTRAELHELLFSAGAQHNLDVNLLASVVKAESGGHSLAISRKGAQGLMQLMPKTAAQLGVSDSLRPEQNVAGGASYLDSLLTRYHDDLALALAAYNAGPAAVDRWHGVPPYRETRLYVARIIRDFNASSRKASRDASLSPARIEQASLTGAIAP